MMCAFEPPQETTKTEHDTASLIKLGAIARWQRADVRPSPRGISTEL